MEINLRIKIMIIILLGTCLFGCKKPSSTTIDGINIGFQDNMRYGDIILARDSSTLFSLMDTAQLFKRYKDSIVAPSTYIIPQDALQDLSRFVNENCNAVMDKRKMQSDIYFVVGTFTNNKVDLCFYYLEQDGILNYFKKMLDYVNKSQYREDLKVLVPSLEKYISNCEKIKLYGKEDWHNH